MNLLLNLRSCEGKCIFGLMITAKKKKIITTTTAATSHWKNSRCSALRKSCMNINLDANTQRGCPALEPTARWWLRIFVLTLFPSAWTESALPSPRSCRESLFEITRMAFYPNVCTGAFCNVASSCIMVVDRISRRPGFTEPR